MDSLADGVFTVDGEGFITSFNRAAEQITGWRREEVRGRPYGAVFGGGLGGDGCPVRQTQQSGAAVVDRFVYIVDRAGRRVPVSVSVNVLRGGGNGRPLGIAGTFRDLRMVEQHRPASPDQQGFADIIGRSPAMRRLFQLLPQYAQSNSTILIEGGSGTGKELFARALHDLSPRRDERFVAVNCAALPDTLLESELFGYKTGAFTDARHDKPGRFALADGGTIFLDEIGDVSPAMQIKLLRVLQERVFEPLGSVEPVKVDVRVIAASNRDLERLVRDGTFREDLYYRINIVRVELPPLSARRGDIPLLVEHFIAKFNRLQHKHVVGMAEDSLSLLLAHDYPGNIRELENIIEHAFVLCRGGLIEPCHLPAALRRPGDVDAEPSRQRLTLQDLEAIHIAETVRRHGGNRRAAAKELGIDPSTLFRKVKHLEVPAARRGRPPLKAGEDQPIPDRRKGTRR